MSFSAVWTEVYIDPSIAANTGTGTIGDPYGDLDYGIVQSTFGANGTRYNVKAGTVEVLTRKLDTILADATGGGAKSPTNSAPCVISGYTAVAGDGGVCSISGGGAVSIVDNASQQAVAFNDCHLHSCGNRTVATVGAYGSFTRCYIESEAVTSFGVFTSTYGKMQSCYVVSRAIRTTQELVQIGGHICDSYIDNSISTGGGSCTADGGAAIHNIVLGGQANGLRVGTAGIMAYNIVYGAGGAAVQGLYNSGNRVHACFGNIVEGYSGAGSYGIRMNNTFMTLFGGNAVYDCTNPIIHDGSYYGEFGDLGDNEILTASPFVNAAAGDFSLRDIGNVIEGALPRVIGGGFV